MIAVEWEARDDKNHTIQRSGMLLQVISHRENGHEVCKAIVITKRRDGDPWVRGPVVKDQYPKILLKVDMEQIRVKGVHIPFEPHGGSE